eukprot:UN05160
MAISLRYLCLVVTLNTVVIMGRTCGVNNTITRGFERLTDDINILLVGINNRKSNCDQLAGVYEFNASSGIIGPTSVNSADYTIPDWTSLTSQNVVVYNKNSNEVTVNSVTTTLPETPFEWEQFYSQYLNLFYVILRNSTRAATDGYVWVYSFDLNNNNWNRIDINADTFNFLLNEEFLSNATWTGTLTEFPGSPMIDKYKVASPGGYYRYNTNEFAFIWEFCCTKFDERTNKMYESYMDTHKI